MRGVFSIVVAVWVSGMLGAGLGSVVAHAGRSMRMVANSAVKERVVVGFFNGGTVFLEWGRRGWYGYRRNHGFPDIVCGGNPIASLQHGRGFRNSPTVSLAILNRGVSTLVDTPLFRNGGPARYCPGVLHMVFGLFYVRRRLYHCLPACRTTSSHTRRHIHQNICAPPGGLGDTKTILTSPHPTRMTNVGVAEYGSRLGSESELRLLLVGN